MECTQRCVLDLKLLNLDLLRNQEMLSTTIESHQWCQDCIAGAKIIEDDDSDVDEFGGKKDSRKRIDDVFACQAQCGNKFLQRCLPALDLFQDREVEIAEISVQKAQAVCDAGVMNFHEFKDSQDRLKKAKEMQKRDKKGEKVAK